jgi:nitroreductase
MTVAEWVHRARSIRRFRENDPVGRDTLEHLVDLARLAASGGNKQPLKYLLSCTPETNRSIFDLLTWAAYLKEWKGPEAGERPAAYIVVLGDRALASSFGCDHGIASQSILLGAAHASWAPWTATTSAGDSKFRSATPFSTSSHSANLLKPSCSKPWKRTGTSDTGAMTEECITCRNADSRT